jgi:uncharacterized membrane protein AbrB (regulator of aidB expression)
MKKPGVNRSVHLFAAPLLWSVIGCMLIIRGWSWLENNHFYWVLLALVAGSLKSVFILDKTAKKSVARLVDFEDGRCLGAVYSWKTWMLVLIMMISGILLRSFYSPGSILGTLYIAIGWSLLFSSRHGWNAWLKRYR